MNAKYSPDAASMPLLSMYEKAKDEDADLVICDYAVEIQDTEKTVCPDIGKNYEGKPKEAFMKDLLKVFKQPCLILLDDGRQVDPVMIKRLSHERRRIRI